MKILKTTIFTLLALLIVGGLALVSYNAYYWKYVAPKYESVSTTYVDSRTYSPDEEYFAELNYYTNELKNGTEVFEFRMNSYTDPEPGDPSGENFKMVYSYGIQLIGTPTWQTEGLAAGRTWRYSWGLLGLGEGHSINLYPNRAQTFYYNTDGSGTSYGATSELGRDSREWIVDFNGRLGLIKEKEWISRTANPVIPKNELLNPTANDRDIRIYHATLGIHTMVRSLHVTVRGWRNGTDVLIFDLSKFFKAYSLMESGDKFETTESAHQNWLFMNVKVNRSPNGMVVASQSIFDKVKNNANWSMPDYEPTDYWRTQTIYNLTVSDFDFLPTATGFNARLKQNAFEFLRHFNDMKFKLVIDVSNTSLVNAGINLVGLAANPFRGLRMDTILIRSAFLTTFNIPTTLPNIETVNVTLTVGGVT